MIQCFDQLTKDSKIGNQTFSKKKTQANLI